MKIKLRMQKVYLDTDVYHPDGFEGWHVQASVPWYLLWTARISVESAIDVSLEVAKEKAVNKLLRANAKTHVEYVEVKNERTLE